MSCSGVRGTWAITYTFNGVQYGPINYPNSYADDNPFFNNESGRAVLRSACDGRNMEPPFFASNFNSVSLVSRIFTADAIQYDCINGSCIPKTTYNTPGIYASLEACETACGTGCSGKCISNAEWAQIESLAKQLKDRTC